MKEPPVNASVKPPSPLCGLRVLVVEDEMLIVMLLEDALEALGCELVGPHESLSSALAAAEGGDYDVALVDFNLQGQQATPLAARLVSLGRPFAIASGGDIAGHGETAHLRKPYKEEDVEAVLCTLAAQSVT